MTSEEHIKEVLSILQELQEDPSVPRNIKNKLQNTIDALREDKELSIRINKALHELDEISDDINLDQYARTQIWNIVSILEKI